MLISNGIWYSPFSHFQAAISLMQHSPALWLPLSLFTLPFAVNTSWHQVSLLLYHLLVVTNPLFLICTHVCLLHVYTYHSCRVYMFNYCFSCHTSLFALCKFLPFVLSAYQHSACCILFPVRTSLLLSTNVYYALSLYFFNTCVLFVLCTLLASCMLIQPCTLIVPCTLIAYFHSMCPCDPFHTGHFILTSRFCFLVAVRTLLTMGILPFAHGPPCSMHFLAICNTILVRGILVAHLTPLANRCLLHYVLSQFSWLITSFPITSCFLTHTHCFTCPFSLMYTCHFVHISCFVYTFSLMHTHCPTYAHPFIHAHPLIHAHSDWYICTISSLSLLVPSTCFSVLTLVAHAYFWLDANSMLSSHLFTSCSCHIFYMLPSHFFCFMHSYYSMHPLCLYLHLLFIHVHILLTAHSLLFPCSPLYHHIISSHILCIFEHQLLICPSSHMSFSLSLSKLLFSWVFCSSDSHSFHHFNVQLCHPPPPHFTTTFLYFIHCYYLLLLLLIFQLHFWLFSLIFIHPHFLSPSFYIFGTTYVWPFSVILWLIF